MPSRSLSVTANGTKNIQSYAVSGAGGGAALAGSVTVWSIDSPFNSSFSTTDKDGNAKTDTAVKTSGLTSTTSFSDQEAGTFSALVK